MARLDDIPAGERELIKRMPVPVFDATPFVKGKPLSQRRVSILSTAALQKRDDKVFPERSQLPNHSERYRSGRHYHVPQLGQL